jgi:hypothetical protein
MVKRVGVLCVAVVLVFAFSGGVALASFGLRSFTTAFVNQAGSPDVLAGSHPWEMVTTLDFNTTVNAQGVVVADGDLKDLRDELPVGFVGDPTATPKCTVQQFYTERELSGLRVPEPESCPVSSQVGEGLVTLPGPATYFVGVFNLVPPPGVPAEFGFAVIGGLKVLLTPSVNTGGDNGLTVSINDISQAQSLLASTIRLWGVPADPSHDSTRVPDAACEAAGVCDVSIPPRPFLTMPSMCTDPNPLTTVIHFDSWQEPGVFQSTSAEMLNGVGAPVGLEGCERLDFSPTVSLTPDTSAADSPAGLAVDIHLPQNSSTTGLAEADLKNTVVTLPAGMTVNASAANGHIGCTPDEIHIENAEAVSCPDASKVGSVEINTPLLESPLLGSVYLASPENNKFHSLLALYIVAEADGVLIKLPGKVESDPVTGQLTTTFEENPQLPFNDLKLNLFGGPRAALVTPLSCGTYQSSAELSPWSGTPPVKLTSSFNISSGCGGGFSPTFTAGTSNNLGGGFSPFSTTFSRADTDEYLGGLSVKTPPGLLGILAKVPLCGEPQAQQGTCPAASAIGTTTVTAGAGPDSVSLPVPGQPPNEVYLTGPYKGAPFGLSVVVPAIAGPFNLGTVVVRATINVDPRTARVTITSDPLPTILRGIPLQVRSINVNIDRSAFMFNATSCAPQKIEATITSTQGTSAALSSPYGAIECARMPFKPKLTASTEGKASANNGGNGASLTVAVTSKGGPGVKGQEANIRKVDVQLPKGLSARLRTLQRACTEQQFAKNPAGCPKESNVGTATAITPVLPVPLKGYAYLVSHGGKAFPELIVVLQGDGVTLNLNGETLIKKAITYSHFQTVPDAPISSFKLTLPERKFSALASPAGNLCGKTLLMPTTIEGQNGAVITQNTKLAVTGCHKKTTKKKPTHK